MTLLKFFEAYYLPHRLRSRSKNTIRLYRHSVNSFSRFLERRAKLSDLTDDTVSRYLTALIARGLSPYTVNKERSQLLAIWTYAAKKRHVPEFPDVPPERTPKRVPQAWTQEELKRLMHACSLQKGEICDIPASAWWTALHLILWDTGERIGAVLKLSWSSYQTPWLLVPAETRKGQREDKLFELGADTQGALDSIRTPKRKLILPWPKAATTIYYHYGRLLRRAELPDGARCKFHRMRRSVASYYEANGGNATELLGHTSRATTAAYLDPRIVRTVQPSDILFRIR
jgi:site-specific recombinase XerD